MRVLVVCHYFPPEIGAPQTRLSELARAWARAGDKVTVLTGMPNHPTGVVPEDYRGRVRVTEEVDGYRIVRTWLYATPNTGMLKKTLGHLSFMVTSLALGLRRTGRADVVVVSSPTFFSVFSAWALARWKRAALVVEVRDLWPAIFVELGVLQNRRVIRLLEALELATYRAAAAVVVVSEGFRDDLLRRGVPAGKVHVIPNGAEMGRFSQQAGDKSSTRAELGASSGETLVLYVGAHGISHGLETVAEAAAKLAGEPIHFAFVGEGAHKERLRARVRELGLNNVTLFPGVARDQIPGLLAAADICLVPLRDVPLFSSFIPSKMFEYMAASKAVVGSVRGEPARILQAAGAVVVEPEHSSALADAVRDLAADPERRAAMGRQGREYVAAHFDRAKLADRYRSVLAQVRPS
jgi:glycosyltransferase involved in cell wall biosynthesis